MLTQQQQQQAHTHTHTHTHTQPFTPTYKYYYSKYFTFQKHLTKLLSICSEVRDQGAQLLTCDCSP